VIVSSDWAAAALGVILGKWNRLEGLAPIDVSQDTLRAATNLVPSFLLWVMRNRPFGYQDREPIERLFAILEEWFQSEQGGLDALRNARHLLTSNSSASIAETFLELIYRLHQQGFLGFTRKGDQEALSSRRRRTKVSIVYLPEQELLWIPVKANGILQEQSWPTLDTHDVSRHLQELGVMRAERQRVPDGAAVPYALAYEIGWCVPEKEWNRRLPVWRSRFHEDSNCAFDEQAV
jgi:hypothetical protein